MAPLLLLQLFLLAPHLRLASAAMSKVSVDGAGLDVVNGLYSIGPDSIPDGFAKTCVEMGWNSQEMWDKLYDTGTPWFKHDDNDSYIYRNKLDGRWWIDEPSGAGVFIIPSSSKVPPEKGWQALNQEYEPTPRVTLRDVAL